MKAHKVCCFWCVNRKCSLYIKIPQYKTLLLIWWKWQPFIQEKEGYCVEPGIMSSYHELQWADQQEEADKNWTLSSGTISFQTQGMSHRFTANTGFLHELFVIALFTPPHTHTQFYISMTSLSTFFSATNPNNGSKKVPLGKSLQQHVFPETLLLLQSIMHNLKNTL